MPTFFNSSNTRFDYNFPSRQRGHRQQPAWISTVTRSPGLNSSTFGPSFTTVPIYSCPEVKFLLNSSPPLMIAGSPWLMISKSVAQTAMTSILTSTSALPGSGTGFSVRITSSGSPRTQAFIFSGSNYFIRNYRGRHPAITIWIEKVALSQTMRPVFTFSQNNVIKLS